MRRSERSRPEQCQWIAEPVIGGELCLRLKILYHGSVRTFDDSLRVSSRTRRPRSGPRPRARRGGRCDRAPAGRIPDRRREILTLGEGFTTLRYNYPMVFLHSDREIYFIRFGLGFLCDVFTVGNSDRNDRPIRPGVSRDRLTTATSDGPCTPRTSPRPLAAPLTLNRLSVAQEYSTIPPCAGAHEPHS